MAMAEDEAVLLDVKARFGRCQALLDASEAIAIHRDLPTLFHDLAQRLPRIVDFDFLLLLLYDAASNRMRLHILEGDYVGEPPPLGLRLEETPAGLVWQTQRPIVLSDTDVETRFPTIWQMWKQNDVKAACLVPLTTAQRRVGALGFGNQRPRKYSDLDLDFLMRVGTQVALAVDNALNYEAAQSYQKQLACERDRLQVLLEITNATVTNLELCDLFRAISAGLRKVTSLDFISIATLEPEARRLRQVALDFPGAPKALQAEFLDYAEKYPPWRAIDSRQPVLITSPDDPAFETELAKRGYAAGLRSACFLPLISRDRVIGTLNVSSRRRDAFDQAIVDLLSQVAGQVAIALDNAQAFGQIETLKDQLAKEKLYLEDEIRTEHNFGEIVGESDALRRVLKQVETVAPTDSTVLVLGETGTGKEVIARAIHNLSSRRERTFVKVNCAAIPSGLLESELFGHERGAFTGAIAQKVGRFELAHRGTLFLDEIGDIPLELQPKLLRVLQEHEFERLGANRTLRVDVRVVAASNRDLGRMVAEKQFRSDLYYRLNVFPIRVPPLRERPEDISLLVRYFAQKFARRMNRQLESLPNETLQALSRYDWPGNVRELQNIVERAVIVSPGPVLHIPVSELEPDASRPVTPTIDGGLAGLQAAERRMILEALHDAKGAVGGPQGAAARLGLKRTTLAYRMRKLGIQRRPG